MIAFGGKVIKSEPETTVKSTTTTNLSTTPSSTTTSTTTTTPNFTNQTYSATTHFTNLKNVTLHNKGGLPINIRLTTIPSNGTGIGGGGGSWIQTSGGAMGVAKKTIFLGTTPGGATMIKNMRPEPAYAVPQVWRNASFKSTSKSSLNPVDVKKKFNLFENNMKKTNTQPEETDLERVAKLELEEDEDEEMESDESSQMDDEMYEDDEEECEDDNEEDDVQVDDDVKPPFNQRIKVKTCQQINSNIKKEELHSDIMYVTGEEKPWVCKNCNRNYKWKNSLKCHLKNECGLPPKYFCSRACGYKTNVHSNLKRHLNSKFCQRRDGVKGEDSA